ncbi:MarC family protein [Geomonas ferrireducens]|uniref:MarC family protein n=1 Tax=Geomonas ferrireducens TaxID=2570227 RepID=UPI0010A773B3|nr:MarC family protein [Geomonas ferrireducens]
MQHSLDQLAVFIVQLFVIVDPLAAVPIFLAITSHHNKGERRAIARRGCLIGYFVIVLFIIAGPALLDYFGIGRSAVLISGGLLLFVIALELLYGNPTGTQTSSSEERLAEKKEDVSVTPLAIPLLAGPGAIVTCLVFASQAPDLFSILLFAAGAFVVFFCAYLLLHWADELARVLGVLGMKVAVRIIGLVLAFIAVQYVINGITELWPAVRLHPAVGKTSALVASEPSRL